MYKSVIIFLFCAGLLSACKDNKYEVKTYYTQAEQDSLLVDIITYVYNRPPYTDSKTRFDSKYRSYYAEYLKDFRFENYFINDKDTHFFYLIRPARNAKGNIRGVGGSFKLNSNGDIVSFREVFNTPVAPLNELREKGKELFTRMVLHGNVDGYLKNPDYIEWPDKMTYYDTLQYEWMIKPGI